MANQKVLIVDDSKTIRMQVKDMLPIGRFEILEAKDGLEGLDLIRQQQPSLVLLDFFMPRMNGWEVVQKIQAQPQLQAIPIVMMSGRKEEVEQTAPELFQYFEFVSKPFEQRSLMEAIRSAMTKAKSRQPAAKPATGADDLQTLKATVAKLQQHNIKLQAEVDGLKKQMAQLVAFVRQKLK
ncbi:response regulator [Microcoleus sp. FACHB-1515]|uniref:response regulator n=1 Tax=Cyanophyceae TaxID=3028117 RepID=UPI00168646D6|nr:response regulator [Microcoleus sp. FACHB-1515]MBD2092533.1 response regulator [Microcoleus sp. FACHB-1515]